MWEELKARLKVILDANALIQETYDYEAEQLKGTPAVSITPSENRSDYETTTANRRVYAFMVRCYVERQGQTPDPTAELSLTRLVDSVLDDLDKNYNLTTVTNPAGYTFLFLEAAPSSWGYAGREGEYRVAEISVKCHVHVDVTIIT